MCYNSGVLRRKGKRRAGRLSGKPFGMSCKRDFIPDPNAGALERAMNRIEIE